MSHSHPGNETSLGIAEFLSLHHPFNQLPGTALKAVADALETRAFEAGVQILSSEEPVTHLYLVRSGAVEIRDRAQELMARLGAGDVFGQELLAEERPARVSAVALDDAEIYLIPAWLVEQLCDEHPSVRYFLASRAGRLDVDPAAAQDDAGVNLMHTPIRHVVAREPVAVDPRMPIVDAARMMSREGISSLLIIDDGMLVGIVTDRDLRTRVVAANRALDEPIQTVMTPSPTTIDASGQLYEAMLIMARSHYHHLPVIDGDRVIGIVTDTDLLQRHSTSPLFVVGDVHRCRSVDELSAVSATLKRLLVRLVEANASCYSIGRVVSSIGEAINLRLIALIEERLGPPPVPYAWLTGGSLARFEQTALSDQDNCLLLHDDYDPEAHGDYFKRLADEVCEGLDACGYIFCPGDIMAKTDKWRQPLTQWRRYFDAWIDEPEPKALMHACIFFDLRRLHGDVALFESLQSYILEKASKNRIFHAYMTSNALTHQPPLGFFGNFVLIKDGEHDRTLDLKHNGVIPIVDIARIYALAGGTAAVNTRERLEAAQEDGNLSESGAADLRDALEFIGTVRLRHQARQIRDGESPDNFVHPEHLSHFERDHLKSAFAIVRTIQSALSSRYQAGRLG